MLTHLDQLKDLINIESFYWFCALLGSGLFAIQFLLNLLGAGEHGSHEIHDYIDDGSAGDAGQFKWLSRQAVTGFLMMFGWTALTCQKEFGLGALGTLFFAFSAGLLTVFATGFIFKLVQKLHSTGHVFNIEEAVGKEAIVYQRIPKDGIGKVSLNLHDLTWEIDAISLHREELASFIRVQIVKKADDHTVVVTAI